MTFSLTGKCTNCGHIGAHHTFHIAQQFGADEMVHEPYRQNLYYCVGADRGGTSLEQQNMQRRIQVENRQ